MQSFTAAAAILALVCVTGSNGNFISPYVGFGFNPLVRCEPALETHSNFTIITHFLSVECMGMALATLVTVGLVKVRFRSNFGGGVLKAMH